VSPQVSVRLLYLLIFLFVGGYGNYFALWLRDQGWHESTIGWLSSLRYLLIIIFPMIWGRMADRQGDATTTLRVITWGAAVCFFPVLLTAELIPIFLAVAAFTAFRVGIIPIADSVTLAHIKVHGGDYGRIRIWGSWGFIAGGFAVGGIVILTSRDAIPAALIALLCMTILLAYAMPRQPREPSVGSSAAAFKRLWRVEGLAGFIFVAFMWRLAGQGLYLFLPLHLENLGVGDGMVPSYWAVGVLSEIVLLQNAHRFFAHRPPRQVLIFCYVCCVLQFGLTAWLTNPLWLYGVMVLHGFTFGVAYYTTVIWLAEHVSEQDKTTAQALFQSATFGIGGSMSAVAAGYLFEVGQGPLMFGVAAAASVVTVVMALLLFRGPVWK